MEVRDDSSVSVDVDNISSLPDYANYMDCPQYDDEAMKLVDEFSFWVEGISQTTVAVFGIVGNIVASVILSRKEMRNAFNLLLVIMACFDSTYLFGSILESFRKNFGLASNLHIVLFPYLLYPFNQIAITASIFMTVAIALERFMAVHYPLNYSQAMHESNALAKRIFKYVSSVTFLAVLFTATRFFEAKVVYHYEVDPITNETLPDNYTVSLEPTHLRTAPIYTAYFNWSRLIVLGIIPFVMLVYLNAKIYQDIKARRNRRLHPQRKHLKMQKEQIGRPFHLISRLIISARRKGGKDGGGGSGGASVVVTVAKSEATAMTTESSPVQALSTNNGLLTEGEDTIELNSMTERNDNNVVIVTPDGGQGQALPPKSNNNRKTVSVRGSASGGGGVTVNESRRKKEDNLAVIFMGFIMVFLVCHLPRLLLNIHELATIRHAMDCQRAGLKAFPLWSLIMISLSHLLLVLNSATNILIYCCLSSKFRDECRKVFRKM